MALPGDHTLPLYVKIEHVPFNFEAYDPTYPGFLPTTA
jgi:hypothetical protein